MSLAECQINPIDVNFHLQKSLEIFDKNSAEKIWPKKDKEIKSDQSEREVISLFKSNLMKEIEKEIPHP